MFKLFLIFAIFSLPFAARAQTAQEDSDRGLNLFARGYKTKNQEGMRQGIDLLESAFSRGSGEAAYNLHTIYYGRLVPEFKDSKKSCDWVLRASTRKYVDAYSGAIACLLENAPPGQRSAVFDKDVVPLLQQTVAESKDAEEVTRAQQYLNDWNQAKRGSNSRSLTDLLNGTKSFGTK
jgi:hypothetical protein